MKGKVGFILFILGAGGLAEFTKAHEVIISTVMLIAGASLIFWEVSTTNEYEIEDRKSNHSDNDNSRPYFLH